MEILNDGAVMQAYPRAHWIACRAPEPDGPIAAYRCAGTGYVSPAHEPAAIRIAYLRRIRHGAYGPPPLTSPAGIAPAPSAGA